MAGMEQQHGNPTGSTNLTVFSDILSAFPRLASRAGSFALYHMPEAMDNIAGKIFNGGSMIADATGQQTANSTITNMSASGGFVQSTAAAGVGMLDAALREGWGVGSDGAAVDGESGSGSVFAMMVQGVGRMKSFGGIFSYLTSRWALATFTAAIVLNRTQFYASSREHLRLRWHTRLALYAIPIVGFLVQLLHILQAMKCQTSPDFPLLRYGDPLKHLSIDFGGEGGVLYSLASKLLWFQDDATACDARSMSLLTMDESRMELRGSMNLLFKFFLTLCASQFFETLACALQGKHPMPETGMTLFEHSLAFAECEAMISSALGFGFFGLPKADSSSSAGSASESSGLRFTRAEILQRINIPPEVLLVCLISCFSHLSSALLAVSGKRPKVRLINTAIWAGCYMSAFIWSFAKIFSNAAEGVNDLGVLRFPTICIVGFIPHLLILVGIGFCAVIYSLALLFTALSVPEDAAEGLSFRQRLGWAYQNLQANVQFSSASALRIKMSEDFYTTLLKIGFSVLTSASEAVYLNEGSRIQVAKMTWVEQKRIDELASSIDSRRKPAVPSELLGDGIARGVEFTDHHNAAISASPYARERKSRPKKSDPDRPNHNELDSGLGLNQRRNRMHLTVDFVSGMFWLVASIQAQIVISALRKLGIEQRPAWLLKAAGVARKPEPHHDPALLPVRDRSLDFWMVMPDGTRRQPSDDNVDVTDETRRMMRSAGTYSDEERLGDRIYGWWSRGGWFGDLDNSDDFQPAATDDDDTTSMISMSTNDSHAEDDWSDTSDSGRRTPTQEDPYADRHRRDETPFEEAGMNTYLARLLDPRSAAERDEARMLSHNLRSPSARPFTRSQYRRDTDRTRNQLLTGLRGQPNRSDSTQHEDDERDLEHFILAQRSKASLTSNNSNRRPETWDTGAEGMGAGGPQCVVCQSCPRTVLVWPCGCLSMCDECRVGLAARNYSKCICCRTDIAAYSRLYVP